MAVLESNTTAASLEEQVDAWLQDNKALVERWRHILAQLRGSSSPSFIMYSVSVRELGDLTHINIAK
jgi:glutamate dehydrogenase